MPKKKPITKKSIKNNVYVDIGALIISFFALLVSLRSCTQAEKSLELAQKDFDSSRLAIWKGTIDTERLQLKISPVSENFDLQFAYVYFPPQIDERKYTVSAPDYSLSLINLSTQLEEFIETMVDIEPDSIVVGENNVVPIIIHSDYIAEGELYQDVSLYNIEYFFMYGTEGDLETPQVTFDGLLFSNRFEFAVVPDEILKTMWDVTIGK